VADYWGLDAIAERVGVHVVTLYRIYGRQRFLMYQRYRKPRGGKKPRLTWYTNDELILRWEVAQCGAQWRDKAPRLKAANRGRGVDKMASNDAGVGA
jgi:transposase